MADGFIDFHSVFHAYHHGVDKVGLHRPGEGFPPIFEFRERAFTDHLHPDDAVAIFLHGFQLFHYGGKIGCAAVAEDGHFRRVMLTPAD